MPQIVVGALRIRDERSKKAPEQSKQNPNNR